MKLILSLLIIAVTFAACNNNTRPEAEVPPQKDTSFVSKSFFPVPDFIGGQLKMVDSFQMPITKSVTINNKVTLTPLPDSAFRALAQNFRQPDIGKAPLNKFYKEESFADQSVPSVTFTYTTADTSLEIQRIDVVIKPDPVQNDKVSSIYIEKSFRKNDTLISQKLYWKASRSFLIITGKRVGNKSLPVEQVKVVWDPTE